MLKGYFTFRNEIKLSKVPVKFYWEDDKSIFYQGKLDYFLKFEDNGQKYVVMLLYVENFGKSSYEVIFTTKEQYDKYNNLIKNNQLTKELEERIIKIIENETGYNNFISVLDKLVYLLEKSKNMIIDLNILPYSITETDNEKKIKIYRQIIEDNTSFKESIVFSELTKGKKIYYYK